MRLPVFNCSKVSWSTSFFWKDGLRSNSARVGITIFGDWDGRMFRSYNIVDNESNVVMIDKAGIIRYFYAGKIDEERFQQIKSLLAELVGQ